jgi:hypothetical protein
MHYHVENESRNALLEYECPLTAAKICTIRGTYTVERIHEASQK